MNVWKNPRYQRVLDQLLACGPLKTWSLIVTILGDLAAGEGARVPGPVLTQLTDPMGMKPEALRVAIHRLRRDGWITSERDGRASLYGLTEHGRALTRSVSERVYAARAPVPARWLILLAPNAEAMQGIDHPELIQVGARAGLLPASAQRGDGTYELPENVLAWQAEPGRVPGWIKALIVPEDVRAGYGALAAALQQAERLATPEYAIERAVLRLVALHQWRRLVLRHGAGTEALMGADWDGALCRARVSTLLARLERPDPAQLAAQDG